MTTTIERPRSADLKARLAECERQLEATKERLAPARRAFASGGSDVDPEQIHAAIRQLEDRRTGLRSLAIDAEIEELNGEIEFRQCVHETQSAEVDRLRTIAMTHGAVDGESQAAWRGAAADYNAEARAINVLWKHREALQRQRGD